MSCFDTNATPELCNSCCNSNKLCEFDGCLDNVTAAPIYVQQIFDAVRFNLQGMRTFSNHSFSPCIPAGHRIKRVTDIRCRRCFNPCNVNDSGNLALDVDTTVSGASFLQDGNGHDLHVIGADGTYSEKIMYAETSSCDDLCKGTPVFGTQNVAITGNVAIELDLLLCDSHNRESIFTVCSEVCIAKKEQPLLLTNFFEICMPSTVDTAFLPRFTEFCNSSCEAKLATNNCGRDLNVDSNGKVSANLIVAICLTCEKKIVVPVQICVLSTGYVNAPLQHNAICTTFPSLFPSGVKASDTEECCPEKHIPEQCCSHEDNEDHYRPSRPQPRR